VRTLLEREQIEQQIQTFTGRQTEAFRNLATLALVAFARRDTPGVRMITAR
jgi:hypothetical protein